MGFWNDFGKAGKAAVKGIGKAADVATDTIVDKDAWGRTVAAIADGKGGKTIKGSDLLNMALDSTMLIPGVGLAGGAARVGVRTAGKMAAREVTEEAAKALAKKTTEKTLLRSPANNAIRGGVDDLLKLKTKDAEVRHGLKWGGERGATAAGNKVGEAARAASKTRAAELAAKSPARNQLTRVAGKQEAGIGRRVGFGQTKRRVLVNSALAGGANLGVRGYDYLTAPGGAPAATKSKKKKDDGTSTDAGALAGLLGGNFTFTTSGGGQQTMSGPEAISALLAAYAEQNGTVDGSQVQYNK